jgi:hypothetical protein
MSRVAAQFASATATVGARRRFSALIALTASPGTLTPLWVNRVKRPEGTATRVDTASNGVRWDNDHRCNSSVV